MAWRVRLRESAVPERERWNLCRDSRCAAELLLLKYEGKRSPKPHAGYEVNYTNICHAFQREINTPLVSCVHVCVRKKER